MYAYHIDRFGKLEVGKELRLTKFNDIKPIQAQRIVDKRFPEGLSRHGDQYFAAPIDGSSSFSNHMYEMIFEYERLLNFSKMPSRF